MSNYQKLSEKEVITSLSDTDNFIVENNGNIRKFSFLNLINGLAEKLSGTFIGTKGIGTITDVSDTILIPEGINRVFIQIFIAPKSGSTNLYFQYTKIFDDLVNDGIITNGFYYDSRYTGCVSVSVRGRYLSLAKDWFHMTWAGESLTHSSIYKFKMRVYY